MNRIRDLAVLFLIFACPLCAADLKKHDSPIGKKSTSPTYSIEPPDILQIELPRLIPKTYRLGPSDILEIQVENCPQESPVAGQYHVDDDGLIDLGSRYGLIKVVGMTVDESTEAIKKQLQKYIGKPDGSVELIQASRAQPINGQYLVGPDGTINLRGYGVVHVAGNTVADAKVLVKLHLRKYLESPEPSVDVVAYNSKNCYLITKGAKLGDSVHRFPVTGNETLLDIVSNVQGLSTGSKKVWISRPAPHNFDHEKILSVPSLKDLGGGAHSATNYQILPGDRIFVADVERIGRSEQTQANGLKTRRVGRGYEAD